MRSHILLLVLQALVLLVSRAEEGHIAGEGTGIRGGSSDNPANKRSNNHTHAHAHPHNHHTAASAPIASPSSSVNTSASASVQHSRINNNDLLQALQKAAGVYTDGSSQTHRHRRSLEKTVIITGCNHGFLNHLLNFKCFMDRLNMKFLVIAMDLHAHSFISNNTTMISYLMNEGAVGEVTGSSQDFRSKQFNLITQKKKEAVHNVMELGYDVLFADTDVAILKDPFDYVLFDNVDYVHSLNLWCQKSDSWDLKRSKVEGNTGFYYARANAKTIKLWQRAYEAGPKFPKLDDQAVFWHIMRTSSDPEITPLGMCGPATQYYQKGSAERVDGQDIKQLVTCFLDTCAFSSGMLSRQYIPEFTYEMLVDNLEYRNQSMCAVHANYIKGNTLKMNKMAEYNLWLSAANETFLADGCKDYVYKASVYNRTA